MELWIITGVSRGLGAALARAALAPNRHVIGISRSGNRGLAAHAARHGAIYEDIHLSLSDLDALAVRTDVLLAAMPARITRAVLINNAGTVEPIGANLPLDAHAVARSLAVNVGAAIVLTSRFIAATVHADRRQVLHVSSGAGRTPIRGWATYCASKAALDMHARCINAEQTGSDAPAKAVSLAPGIIDTEMQLTIRETDHERFPEVERFRALKSEGRLRTPDDAARAVLDYLDRPDFGMVEVDAIRTP